MNERLFPLHTLGFLRTAVISPEVRVADIAFNTQAILAALERAAAQGCLVAVLPELAITGYSCSDLFYQALLLQETRTALSDDCGGHRRAGSCCGGGSTFGRGRPPFQLRRFRGRRARAGHRAQILLAQHQRIL